MAAEYVQKHQLAATIERAITDALASQPSNPYLALADWLAAGGAKAVAKKQLPSTGRSASSTAKPAPTTEAKEVETPSGAAGDLMTRLVLGAAVLWVDQDDEIPQGQVGEIVEDLDDGYMVVEFGGKPFELPASKLVPATAAQQAALYVWKAQAAKEHAAALKLLAVGGAVTWTEADDDIPAGTVGEIVEMLGDGNVDVRFPAGTAVSMKFTIFSIKSSILR